MHRTTFFLAVLFGASCQGFLTHRTPARTTAHDSASLLRASNENEPIPLQRGSTVALVTPYLPDGSGEIDTASLRKLLRYHVASGTTNLCILGTTGEASAMSMEERKLILTTAVEEVKGKMPILVGTGTINPNAVQAMNQQAADLGCDAVLVTTPYYVKPPQRGLVKHMVDAANGSSLPVVIYNVPGRTAVNMSDESIALAAQHDNVVAVKDATGDLSRVTNLRTMVKDGFLIYSGDDSTTTEFLALGGDGCISVTANVAAPAMAQMVAEGLAGHAEEASKINDKLVGLHKKLFCESSPMPVKWALKRLGMIESAYCRPPLAEMDDAFIEDVEGALRQAGLL